MCVVCVISSYPNAPLIVIEHTAIHSCIFRISSLEKTRDTKPFIYISSNSKKNKHNENQHKQQQQHQQPQPQQQHQQYPQPQRSLWFLLLQPLNSLGSWMRALMVPPLTRLFSEVWGLSIWHLGARWPNTKVLRWETNKIIWTCPPLSLLLLVCFFCPWVVRCYVYIFLVIYMYRKIVIVVL